MQRKTVKLRFVEDAAAPPDNENRAAAAQRKATQRKMQQAYAGKLKFKRDISNADDLPTERKKPQTKTQGFSKTLAAETAAAPVRQQLSEAAEDNPEVDAVSHIPEGVQAVQAAGRAAEKTAGYAKKLASDIHAGKLQEGTAASRAQAAAENAVNAADSAATAGKFQQKRQIKKQYQTAKRTADSAAAAADSGFSLQSITNVLTKVKEKGAAYVSAHSGQIVLIILIAGLLFMVASMVSSCTVMSSGASDAVLTSSYTAEDADILGAEEDYKSLEEALRDTVDNIESDHPGYDEYNYDLDEIGHNPYELASYLTVLFEDYTRAEVQTMLQQLFDEQYKLTLTPVVEHRTRTAVYEDGTTAEEEYEYRILNVSLENRNLGTIILQQGMSESDTQRYKLLNSTYGNPPYLFGSDIYAVSTGEYEDYDIPVEALTDADFANMIGEAEKYLGMPYVWGGSDPSTGFDCSGFVSYVINHCANGWNVGRCTANGLLAKCTRVSASEAKPGDLIFFQGTCETPGASHVGIYVGNGMMIHCGNPISYTSIEKSYWQSHFYTFGRLNS